MKVLIAGLVLILAFVAGVVWQRGQESKRMESLEDSPSRMARGCAAHCVEYGGEFSLHRRRTIEGNLYGWCKCMGEFGVVAHSIRGIGLDGTISGDTPFERTAEADRFAEERYKGDAPARLQKARELEKQVADLLKEAKRLGLAER